MGNSEYVIKWISALLLTSIKQNLNSLKLKLNDKEINMSGLYAVARVLLGG